MPDISSCFLRLQCEVRCWMYVGLDAREPSLHGLLSKHRKSWLMASLLKHVHLSGMPASEIHSGRVGVAGIAHRQVARHRPSVA